jgi:hypothetical protein
MHQQKHTVSIAPCRLNERKLLMSASLLSTASINSSIDISLCVGESIVEPARFIAEKGGGRAHLQVPEEPTVLTPHKILENEIDCIIEVAWNDPRVVFVLVVTLASYLASNNLEGSSRGRLYSGSLPNYLRRC